MPIIRLKRFLSTTWAADNPTLDHGEPGLETDTGRLKIGANSQPWNALPYVGRSIEQAVYDTESNLITSTNVIPLDNSVPGATEGVQVLSATITPTDAANTMLIMASVLCSAAAAGSFITMAAFRDDSWHSIAAASVYQSFATGFVTIPLIINNVAGIATPITYSIRVGPDTSTTLSVNGISGSRYFGSTPKCTLAVLEVKV